MNPTNKKEITAFRKYLAVHPSKTAAHPEKQSDWFAFHGYNDYICENVIINENENGKSHAEAGHGPAYESKAYSRTRRSLI